MIRQEQKESWHEIKEIWGNSSQGESINFQFSKLIDELKSKMSRWEKNAVESDMVKLRSSWEQYKGNVSTWEKESISKDLSKILKLIKKLVKKLRRKN